MLSCRRRHFRCRAWHSRAQAPFRRDRESWWSSALFRRSWTRGQRRRRLAADTWYRRIRARFSSRDRPARVLVGFSPNASFVAQTSGGRIMLSTPYLLKAPDDLGVLAHEMTHVVQAYSSPRPGWLTEGIADYVRYYGHRAGLAARALRSRPRQLCARLPTRRVPVARHRASERLRVCRSAELGHARKRGHRRLVAGDDGSNAGAILAGAGDLRRGRKSHRQGPIRRPASSKPGRRRREPRRSVTSRG